MTNVRSSPTVTSSSLMVGNIPKDVQYSHARYRPPDHAPSLLDRISILQVAQNRHQNFTERPQGTNQVPDFVGHVFDDDVDADENRHAPKQGKQQHQQQQRSKGSPQSSTTTAAVKTYNTKPAKRRGLFGRRRKSQRNQQPEIKEVTVRLIERGD